MPGDLRVQKLGDSAQQLLPGSVDPPQVRNQVLSVAEFCIGHQQLAIADDGVDGISQFVADASQEFRQGCRASRCLVQ